MHNRTAGTCCRATAVAAFALLAPPAAFAACGGEAASSGVVRAIADGRTLTLRDGRTVRLAGIDIPPTSAAPARRYLEARLAGQKIAIRGPAATDRYGRLRGFVFASAQGLEAAIQADMVARGIVRVAPRVGDRDCAAELFAREQTARAQGLGLWSDPANAVRRADDAATLRTLRGRLALVEGRVLSVRPSGGTIYVNFGRRWSRDFTVTIAKRNARRLAAGGLDPQRLAGRTVRIRGVVEERGGPWIEVVRPEQVEVVP